MEEALPEIRKRVAKEMYTSGVNQVEISKLLGVSQAMVSKYLKEQRVTSEHMEDYIENLTGDLTVTALSDGDRADMTAKFCGACLVMKGNNVISDAYLKKTGFELPDVSCFNISMDNDVSRVIDELMQALSYLNKNSPSDLVPEVKLNIASCVKDCERSSEVIAFPGRLTFIDGKFVPVKAPCTGSSNHLSSILGAVRKRNFGISSIMNIALNEDIKSALIGLDLKAFTLNRDRSNPSKELSQSDLKGINYIADPGDFGIEPCLYIIGNSSLSVAARAVKIQKEITRIKEGSS